MTHGHGYPAGWTTRPPAGRPADSVVIAKLLVANRRAAQLLRLLDQGDREGADALLQHLRCISDWVYLEANLASIRSTSGTGPDSPIVTAELDRLRAAAGRDFASQRAWLMVSAECTLQRLTTKWPRRQDRMRYYQHAGQRAFDSEEPGSFVRRVFFGEGV